MTQRSQQRRPEIQGEGKPPYNPPRDFSIARIKEKLSNPRKEHDVAMELPRHPIGHFCARCLDQFYLNLFNLSFALDHFASFFCKGKGIILKLGTVHPQITYKKF
jgi:hypothetical protein